MVLYLPLPSPLPKYKFALHPASEASLRIPDRVCVAFAPAAALSTESIVETVETETESVGMAEPTNGSAESSPAMSMSTETTHAPVAPPAAAAADSGGQPMSKSEMKKRAKAERVAKEKAEKERLRLEKQQQQAKEKAASGIQELEIDDSLTPAVRLRVHYVTHSGTQYLCVCTGRAFLMCASCFARRGETRDVYGS